MSFISQRFTDKDVEVKFMESENIEASFRSHEHISILISVRKKHILVSLYEKLFKQKINPVHYKNFVNKFLEAPSYRKQYLKEGYTHWDGVIEISTSNGIHKRCEEQILIINSKSIVKFKDLAKLKTFGRDKFSSMGIENLKEILDKNTYLFIEKRIGNQMELLSALRWVARGLIPEHAIYKIKVDAEIEKNKQMKSIE